MRPHRSSARFCRRVCLRNKHIPQCHPRVQPPTLLPVALFFLDPHALVTTIPISAHIPSLSPPRFPCLNVHSLTLHPLHALEIPPFSPTIFHQMEISLLLSAAQAAPAPAATVATATTVAPPPAPNSAALSPPPPQPVPSPRYLISSPVSHHNGSRTSDLLHDDFATTTNDQHSVLARPQTAAPMPFSLGLPQGRIEKKPNKPFRCTVEGCDATFGQKGSLTRHVKSRHEKLRPHSCDVCQKSFSALWTLRVHQRNVHLKSKPHKCHLCDKSFGELFNKSKHIAIVHEGKRPFSCPICSRAFGYKGDMRKHVLELHEQSGRPFQCMVPSCGVKFARKRYLRRHENLSHKGNAAILQRDHASSPETSPNFSYSLTGQRPSLFYLEGTSVPKTVTEAGKKENEFSQKTAMPITDVRQAPLSLPQRY